MTAFEALDILRTAFPRDPLTALAVYLLIVTPPILWVVKALLGMSSPSAPAKARAKVNTSRVAPVCNISKDDIDRAQGLKSKLGSSLDQAWDLSDRDFKKLEPLVIDLEKKLVATMEGYPHHIDSLSSLLKELLSGVRAVEDAEARIRNLKYNSSLYRSLAGKIEEIRQNESLETARLSKRVTKDKLKIAVDLLCRCQEAASKGQPVYLFSKEYARKVDQIEDGHTVRVQRLRTEVKVKLSQITKLA